MRELLNAAPSTSASITSPEAAIDQEGLDCSVPTQSQEGVLLTENQEPTPQCVIETPVGAERPPSPPSCDKCSRLSKSLRRFQKENCYLRKRNRELKDQLNHVSVVANRCYQV